jgi:hypothetical protein
MIRARAVCNAVYLETDHGCGDVASWACNDHEAARFQVEQINAAMQRNEDDLRKEIVHHVEAALRQKK